MLTPTSSPGKENNLSFVNNSTQQTILSADNLADMKLKI